MTALLVVKRAKECRFNSFFPAIAKTKYVCVIWIVYPFDNIVEFFEV